MSLFGASSQSAYPDEFSNSMADLTACIVQEQLAPILKTLREHAKLLDLHAALLNHSTAMNRYNVGKLDDIRDFQANINYKLQFYVDPEERTYPTYRNPPAPAPSPRAETLSNMASLPLGSVPDPSDEPTESSADDSSATVITTPHAPESQDPPSSPTTELAPSPPPSPQFTGEAFALVPGSSRQLQRERPFAVQPDPMWNSTRAINTFLQVAAPPPPPPYVEPPAYTTEDPVSLAAESQTQDTTLIAERASTPPSAPRPESEAEVEVAISAGPSMSNIADNTPRTPSPLPSPIATISMAGVPGPLEGEDDPDAGTSAQLSEKARGKKRMLEEDYSSDEDENDENDDPFVEGSSSGSSSRLDGSDRKRKKRDTRINTDRLDLSPCGWGTQRTSFMDKLYTLSDRRRHAEKLKSMQRLYRGAQ